MILPMIGSDQNRAPKTQNIGDSAIMRSQKSDRRPSTHRSEESSGKKDGYTPRGDQGPMPPNGSEIEICTVKLHRDFERKMIELQKDRQHADLESNSLRCLEREKNTLLERFSGATNEISALQEKLGLSAAKLESKRAKISQLQDERAKLDLENTKLEEHVKLLEVRNGLNGHALSDGQEIETGLQENILRLEESLADAH